jgi:hypothetical protein
VSHSQLLPEAYHDPSPERPLAPLTDDERDVLHQISRARSEPASHVVRTNLLLAVAAGQSYTAAAQSVGRRFDDAVAELVARFNRQGLAVLTPRHASGAPRRDGTADVARIRAEVNARPIASAMAPRPGRSRPCNRPCARQTGLTTRLALPDDVLLLSICKMSDADQVE